jgi:hypothetical protein
LNKVIENRGGNYCHVVEVGTVYELECIESMITSENINEFAEVIAEFLKV